MNAHELRKNFDALIREHAAPCPAKFKELLELRDSIAQARKKGASYETIRSYLRQTAIMVSADTVARFCHQFLSEPKRRATKGRPRRSQPERNGASAAQALEQKRSAAPSTRYQAPTGPRIVDPKNL